MTTLTLYTLILFVHVLAGAFLIGGGLHAPMALTAVRRARDVGELRAALGHIAASSRFNPLVALVLLGTGVWLGSHLAAPPPWLVAACVLWVVNCALAAGVVAPFGRKLARALGASTTHDPISSAVDRRRRAFTWDLATGAMLANDLGVLLLMLARPSLGLTLAILVVAHGAALGLGGLLAARRASPARPRASVPAAPAPARARISLPPALAQSGATPRSR